MPTPREPEKVDAPRPFTWMRFETENEVEDAMGRILEPVTLRPPAKMVSPVDTRSPFEEARPDEERPPEKLEVPMPVETILPPVRRKSPAVDSMPEVDLRPAEESPPVKVEVPDPETVRRFVMLALPSFAWPVASKPPAKVDVPSPFTFRRFAIEADPVVEELSAVMRPEKFPATALRSPRDSRDPARR